MKKNRGFLRIVLGLGLFIFIWAILPQNIVDKLFHWENISKWGKNLVMASVQAINTESGENNIYAPNSDLTKNYKTGQKAMETIQVLTSPEMEGRRAGTTGETMASFYLVEQLHNLGLSSLGTTGYFQVFTIPPMEERYIGGRALFRSQERGYKMPSCNILAGLPGEKKDEKIILSAHYDHLGIFNGQLHAGANDNASGVACVLEIMQRLVRDQKEGIRPQKSIIVAFWGAEEMGYLGSGYFKDHPTVTLSEVKGMINLDSVGNGDTNDFIIWNQGHSRLAAQVKKIGHKNGAQMRAPGNQKRFSDEISFRNAPFPAITILSQDWLQKNHTPEDDFNLINENKLDLICDIVYQLIYEL